MSTQTAPNQKITVTTLQAKKQRQEPISMVTAYDFPTAQAVDQAGIDSILVGDSLGMVVLGYDSTLPVTMADMLHHCKAVARATKRPFLIGDMPFMSYQVELHEAVRNAGRLLAEGGMDAVKLEGGAAVASTVQAIVQAGMPVVGHIGLTPQSVHQLGGFKVQGKSAAAALQLLDDALRLQAAGCCAIVLEAVPDRVATLITQRLRIPTIGIGAGVGCDGQVLVLHDLAGLFSRFTPRFVKQYAQLQNNLVEALSHYHTDVITRQFPSESHSFTMNETEWQALLQHTSWQLPAEEARISSAQANL